jgi:predicted TIM-barrel fold metal-dependent hydrolase
MASKYPYRVIDADGHIVEPPNLWVERAEEKYRERVIRWTPDKTGVSTVFTIDGRQMPPESKRMPPALGQFLKDNEQQKYAEARAAGWSPASRLKDMDKEGIDTAVLFPSIAILGSGATEDPALAQLICRIYNDWLAEYCAAAPQRLVGVALIYLHDIPTAVKEVTRAVTQLGMKGVFTLPGAQQDRNLHNPVYFPLYAELERLGVPLCVHQATSGAIPVAGADRIDGFFYKHIVSHPFEQMMACMTLICGGVLERFPALKVVFLESGCGWLPYMLWRMDEHHEVFLGEKMTPMKAKPSEYFARQCYISCDPDEWVLPRIIDLIGEDNLVIGSDYPHVDSRFPDTIAKIGMSDFFPDRVKRKILGENAARLYGLA